MSSSAAPTAPARNILRRFGRSRQGSAIVEFALVAPIFIALLFAIIETALMFFAGQVLETMNESATRLIQTGQAQGIYPDAGTYLQQVVCNPAPVLFNCNNIYVDVKSYTSFNNVAINSQIVNGNFDNTNLGYNLGGSCDVVVARLFYKWPLFVTGLGWDPSNLSGHQRLLVATAAFRNEPFGGACGS